jgi:autotransporter translocation and assembly factor TamB
MATWRRWIVRTVLALVLSVVVLVAAAVVSTQTPWFHEWARGLAERQAGRLINGQLSIGRLEGTLWTGATLSNVRITQDGRVVVAVDRVRVEYDWRQLASRHWLFPRITLTRPSIVLITDDDGWRIAKLVRPRQNQSTSAGPVQLPSLVIEDGRVGIEDLRTTPGLRWPATVAGLHASMGLTLSRGLVDLSVERAAFEARNPSLTVAALQGHWVQRDGRHDVTGLHLQTSRSVIDGAFAYAPPPAPGTRGAIRTHLTFAPFDAAEFAETIPALAGRPLVLSGEADVDGSLDAMAIKANVADPAAGGVEADVTLTTDGDRRALRGDVRTVRLDLAPILKNPSLASRLTSSDQIDLVFSGPFSFDTLSGSARVRSTSSGIWGYQYDALDGTVRFGQRQLRLAGTVQAYGARATTSGTIVPADGPVRYDLRGAMAGVDVRRLPRQIPVPKLETQLAGQYVVSGSGARIDASATFEASVVEGAAIGSGSTGRFNNQDQTLRYGFTGHVAHADIQRFGRVLDVAAISGDDYASDVTGQIDVSGSGTTIAGLVLDASGQLEPSRLFDVEIGPADVSARIADATLTGSVNGRVAGVDVERATKRADLAGRVAGQVSIDGSIARLDQPFSIDAVTARGSVTLDPSVVGPLELETARVEGSLRDGVADVTALEVHGPRLDATAKGTLALGERGESNLAYEASMTRLSDIGPLVGRMLDGRVAVTGTITGTRAEQRSVGTASFSGLAIDDTFSALTLQTAFDGRMAHLDPTSLTAKVKAESTLAVIQGRTIPSLSATVDYANSRYAFEATANETGRTITAGGELALLENGRTVTVNSLALTSNAITWSLAGDGPARIRWEPTLLSLETPLTLINNGQYLSAEGTFALTEATPGSLDITIAGVEMTDLGTLLLSQRQLAGTLTGDARVTGTPTTRNIVGNISLLAGVVDGYAFQSLHTLVNYRNDVANVAAVLIQSPTAKLEANGTIPYSLDRGAFTDQPLDVNVTSAGVDLAVLEAANTGLTQTSGRLVVDLHVSGTGTAPVARGTVAVQDGAFTVAATGVRYAQAAIDAMLEGDALQVTRLHLVDGDNDALEGSGRLTIVDRAVRDIEFVITGNDVTVLDNELGRVSVDTSLNLFGTIRAPQVAGLVRLHTGRIEVDQVLDRFGSTPYEVVRTPASAEPAADDGSRPIALNLTVQVPDNLVLRGRDMRAGNSSVPLGDVNLTAGGDFTLVRQGTGAPVLIGTISTVRGTYDFQGRRFQVLRDGTIMFRGESPIDPALNVAAERVISGIVAHVNVGGTMRSPDLTLSSQPPLDQADILSLIVFNQPVNRLGQGQATNLGERAAALAGGVVTAPLANTLGRALNVDVFELDTSGDEGEGPSVTIGDQVGERLFVRFRQLFGPRDVSEFQLEYQLAQWLRLQGSFAEGQTSANRSLTRRVERGGIDLVVYFSY